MYMCMHNYAICTCFATTLLPGPLPRAGAIITLAATLVHVMGQDSIITDYRRDLYPWKLATFSYINKAAVSAS